MTTPLQFPDALVRWAGHHEGGVRRPFQQTSGRPTGSQIETPLVKRLNEWVAKLVAGGRVPRIILLVGGPGNGKTDAVEGCIDRLDRDLGAAGELRQRFAERLSPQANQIAPRKVVVDLTAQSIAVPEHLRCSLALVQDATQGEPADNASPESLLLAELTVAANNSTPDIYICCVNRGILATASTLAHESQQHQNAAVLIDQITQAVTNRPESPPCWPLSDYSHIAIWPMDMESLVAPKRDGSASVGQQIIESAIDANRWKQPCEQKTRCPFCQNRVLLARKGATEHLVTLLYYFELASGKRWTFRDLFSVVSHILVGDESELTINGTQYTPCAWAAEQWRLHKQGTPNSADRDRAIYLRATRLYHHRLFPTWPSLDNGKYRQAKQDLLRDGQLDQGLLAAKAFFRFMARAQVYATLATGDIPELIRKALGPTLEPAVATGQHILFGRDGTDITIEQIEDAFSSSVATGLTLLTKQLETLERDALEHLARADASLAEDNFTGMKTHSARLLRTAIRQFATRIAKRSVCTRKGLCRDVENYREYVTALTNDSEMNDVRRRMKALLHDKNDKFRAPLATTFGQPVAERSRDVSLVLPRMVTVQLATRNDGSDRPPTSTPFFTAEGHAIAVTFDLFRALRKVAGGMHAASLPTDIYSLLDRIKSLVAGNVSRNPDTLANEPRIILGASGDALDYVNGAFDYSNGDDE